MKVNTSNLMILFRDHLTNNTILNNWCKTNFGCLPFIFLGVDAQNPPGIDSLPFIAILPEPTEEGEEVNILNFAIEISYGIDGDYYKKTHDDRVITYPAIQKIDVFGEHIWDVVTTSSYNVALSQMSLSIEAIEFWPMMLGQMSIRVNVPNTIGGLIEL